MSFPVDAAADRHRRIIERLDSQGRVEVGDLSGRLVVAPETIRRDLRLLEGQGLLQRVHGGAVRRAERALSPFDGIAPEHPPQHLQLAAHVVERLPDRGTVFLAASPLTWAVAESLSRRPGSTPGLTVVTTSLDVAVVLSRVESMHVYNVGGSVDPEHRAQQGDWALEEIRRFRVQLALITPSGVTVDEGIFSATPMAAAITAAEVQIADRVWLMLEAEQLGQPRVVHAADISSVDHVFTAGTPNNEQITPFREAGIKVTTAE